MSDELARAIESARCVNCAHGEPSVLEDETLTIQCLRYPPQLFVLDGEVSQCVPQMVGDAFCGEWKTKDTCWCVPNSRHPACPVHP